MSVKVGIIGLGQIGASIGMALKNYPEELIRVGYDRHSRTGNLAKGKGAVDKLVRQPSKAVKDADIVVIAVPLNETEGVLKIVAPMLKNQAVVLDTSPVRGSAFQWSAKLMPSGRHFVGFTPLISPYYLLEVEGGVEGAKEDLFEDGMIAITNTAKTDPEALNLASELAVLLKATPLFADWNEVDGMMATMHVMPQLIAAALANVTAYRQGWQDARKFTGRPYMLLTSLISEMDQPSGLAIASVTNKHNTARALDDLIGELQSLRDEIDAEDQAGVEVRLKKARDGRDKWWHDRMKRDWEKSSMPKGAMDASRSLLFGGLFGNLFGRKQEEDE